MHPVRARAAGGDEAEQLFADHFPGLPMQGPGAAPIEVELDMFTGSADLTFIDYTIQGAMFARVGSTAGAMISAADLDGQLLHGREPTDPGQPWLTPDGLVSEYDFTHARLLALAQDAIDRHLAALPGRASAGPFRFTHPSPRTAAHGAYWRSVVAMVQPAMVSGAIDEPILARSFTEFVIKSALVCFPHNWQEPATGPSLFATSAMRRAKAHIDDHAGEPLTVTDIAQAARISPRHLQGEFRRHYGVTPMRYLRQARLALAREKLLRTQPGEGSVAAIAQAAGFTHLGRFAAAYHEAYGEYPRDTFRH